MSREEAKLLVYQLINSGILDSELESKLTELAEHICKNDFDKCTGTEYCENCQFRKPTA